MGHLVAGYGGPADGQNHGLLLREPGVIDAPAPHDVVALSGQQDTAPGQFHPETPADENQQGGAFFARHPAASAECAPRKAGRPRPARSPPSSSTACATAPHGQPERLSGGARADAQSRNSRCGTPSAATGGVTPRPACIALAQAPSSSASTSRWRVVSPPPWRIQGVMTIPLMGGLFVSSTVSGRIITRTGKWKGWLPPGHRLTGIRAPAGPPEVRTCSAAVPWSARRSSRSTHHRPVPARPWPRSARPAPPGRRLSPRPAPRR